MMGALAQTASKIFSSWTVRYCSDTFLNACHAVISFPLDLLLDTFKTVN